MKASDSGSFCGTAVQGMHEICTNDNNLYFAKKMFVNSPKNTSTLWNLYQLPYMYALLSTWQQLITSMFYGYLRKECIQYKRLRLVTNRFHSITWLIDLKYISHVSTVVNIINDDSGLSHLFIYKQNYHSNLTPVTSHQILLKNCINKCVGIYIFTNI